MLIYPKNKKSDQKDSPVWKEDNFLRLRGLADALVHKTDFKTEDGKNVLAGAYYERVRRELETLEAAKLAQLSKSLGPKAAALKAMPEPTGGSSNSSSWNRRCWRMRSISLLRSMFSCRSASYLTRSSLIERSRSTLKMLSA